MHTLKYYILRTTRWVLSVTYGDALIKTVKMEMPDCNWTATGAHLL